MANTIKRDTTTGNGTSKIPILADEKGHTEAPSKPAQTKKESASITPAAILALLQTDCFDLRGLGLNVTMQAENGRLYIGIEYPGRKLDTGRGHILLDGLPVSGIEEE